MAYIWDERYAAEEYVYGTAPNAYFKQEIDKLKPGKILLPAEGEGRNAVYAAERGWDVHAFDLSREGKKKALKLAELKNVKITYNIIDFEDIDLESNHFDLAFLCYAHFPCMLRQKYHQKVLQALKQGGTMLLEGFSKSQIKNNTGGPKNQHMLFSKEELDEDFVEIENSTSEYHTEILDEGALHSGEAEIIRFKGIK